MRPLFRSLFILSVFGLLATHISSGLGSDLGGSALQAVIGVADRWLRILLVDPLGRELTVLLLWGAGGALAVWSFVTGAIQARGSDQRHSTW